jgi:DNA (cytosine-5)-methyltransferase 1
MLVNTTAQRLKVLELFGGIGSPRKALENLGIDTKTVDYVEWWDWPVKAYNKLFKHLYKPQNILDWNMDIDILIHGSPCQDFSVAGKNDLSSGRSILYLRTLEIIGKELKNRPKVVVWENVKGLLSKKNFPHFKHYLDTMESFGYENHYKVLNSKEFGIPQSRNRVFVVSILKGQALFNNDFNFDNLEKTEMKPLKSFLEKEVDKSYYITQNSMKKAIETGKIKIIDNVCETITTKQFRWNNAGVVKVPLRDYESSKVVLNPNNAITPTLTGNHGETPFKVAIEIVDGNYSWKGKIMVDAIEPIEGVPIFIIDNKPYHLRVLTQRETWRLMGWDDNSIDKVIDMPKTHMYHMAGNAIVIQVLEAIFKELFRGSIYERSWY